MNDFNGTELGRMVNLAQGEQEVVSLDRIKKRLSQSKRPTTQDSTGAWVNWENMGTLLGQPFDSTKIPLSKLDQMRRDPMISFGLAAKIVPLIRAKWYIKSQDPQRATFIDNSLRLIYARYILGRCNAFSFGYSPGVKRFEYFLPDWTYVDYSTGEYKEQQVWPSKTVDALIWKNFVWLDPRKVQPHWTKKGEFTGIDHGAPSGSSAFFNSSSGGYGSPNGKAADIPLDWALWATHDKDSVFGSLFGYPLIGHAYRYWWSYWYKFGLSDRAFEKWADPPVIAYHPAEIGIDSDGNQVDYGDVALATAEKIRSGANVSMPSTVVTSLDQRQTSVREWELKQMSSEANFDSLIQSFNYLDVMKLRAISVPEQGLIEGAQGQSSRNVAIVMTEKIEEQQAIHMEEIDAEINRFLIPQLLEANFGPGGSSCTKVTTGFDPKDVETMRAIVGAVANKQGEIPDVDMRELLNQLGLPLLSHAAVQKRLEEIAQEQERERAFEVESRQGFAGINAQGLYEAPRERIELQEDTPSFWKKIAMKISREEEDRNAAEKMRQDSIIDQFKEIGEKVAELAEKDTTVQVDVEIPKPTRWRKIKKKVFRDEEGNIVDIEETQIEEED